MKTNRKSKFSQTGLYTQTLIFPAYSFSEGMVGRFALWKLKHALDWQHKALVILRWFSFALSGESEN